MYAYMCVYVYKTYMPTINLRIYVKEIEIIRKSVNLFEIAILLH